MVVLAVFLGFAVSVDYPRAATGFKGDEATYYSLTLSIARDFDVQFQRHDLVRVWEEFPGPDGIFLKKGSKVDSVRWQWRYPFVVIERSPDAARGRLYYGKSYIYPLFAAPWVRLFGTRGFLIFHALLLALNFYMAHAFLVARGSSPWTAAGVTGVFLFASVVPVYFVWLAPELFNFSLVLNAYVLWAYKLAIRDGQSTTGEPGGSVRRWLMSPASDYAAAVLLGIATFSKPTHVLLMLPLLVYPLARRQLRRAAAIGVCFAAVVAVLFSVNAASSGEFNYQGSASGQRKSFYGRTGFPFANTWETFDNVGQGVATDAVPTDILLHRDTATVLGWNLMYFVIGRYSGLLPYFFPAMLAVMLFLRAGRQRPAWQWHVAATVTLSALALISYMPYTYSGGGGPIGNRYFLSFYPLFLFLMPAVSAAGPTMVTLAISALFVAKIVLNPFYSSFHPGEHAKAGPLRLLPIERTLLNDLPVSADPDRARRSLGGSPPVSAYFVDDNAFPPEGDAFWTKGDARADLLLRAPAWQAPDDRMVPLRIRRLGVEITNGSVANRVTVRTGLASVTVDLAPGEVRSVDLPAGAGVPYKPARFPTNYVYSLSVSTSAGFVPFLETTGASTDSRYLGASVRVVPVYDNPE